MLEKGGSLGVKDKLHHLVDDLPDSEVHAAQRYLSYLALLARDPVLGTLLGAPPDDEELTDEDRRALQEGREDVAASRGFSDGEARRRLRERA